MIPQHLLLRLLNNPLLYKGGDVKFILGQLPDHLPIELPIVKQAKIVASVSYGQDNFYIFLELPDSSQQIQTIYRNILIGKGWRKLPRNEEDIDTRLRLGFSYPFPNEFTESTTYCNRKQNASLVLTTLPLENSTSKATLKLELALSSSLCQAEWERKTCFNSIPMPFFIEPTQTKITKGIKNGGSPVNLNTISIITTKLDHQTLLAHYYPQMEEMGWNNITAAEESLLSISLWEFKDSDNRNWRGLFKWTKIAEDSDKYIVDFEVIKQSSIDGHFASAIQAIPLNNIQISRELALHILENVFEINKPQKSQLLVGELPSEFPLDLPMPDNAEVVGSLDAEDCFRILLEIPESPARIEHFYRQELMASAWEKCEAEQVFAEKNGFISSGYKPFEWNIFCHKKGGWELHFNTHPSRSNSTDLRLQVKKITPNSLCSFTSHEERFPLSKESRDNMRETLIKQFPAPILTAPTKAEVLFLNPVGAGGIQFSHDRDGKAHLGLYSSSALIQTKLGIEELANHYFVQMTKYNWKEVSNIKQSLIAVGFWMFENEQGDGFQATIDIVKNQNFSQQYAASLKIVSTDDLT